MICNKKEWEIIDDLTSVCVRLAKHMTEKQKNVVNEFIYLCAKSTEDERVRREKAAEKIKEKRKINPDYARPEREHRKKIGGGC